MYRLDILNTTGSSISTVLFAPDVTVERWSKRINAPGRMVFAMHANDPKATDEALQVYRRVRLYRQRRDGQGGFQAVWYGYVEEKNESDGRIEVSCAGPLQLFKKRYAAKDEVFNGEGSTEAFGLLSDANSQGATGIAQGTGGVTTTRDVKAQGDVDMLRAWELLAQAHGTEFEIDDDGNFNFVPSLGSDKSGSIHLIFRRDGRPGTNVIGFERGESGADMGNRVIGKSTAGSGLTSTQNDATSQTAYGLLVVTKQLNEAQDQTTLDSMSSALLTQIANPLTDFRLQPEMAAQKFNVLTGQRAMKGLQYTDVVAGDLVKVTTVTENRSVTEVKRIAEIAMDVDEEGMERLSLTLSKSGVFITAGYLDASRVQEMTRKIQAIESVL